MLTVFDLGHVGRTGGRKPAVSPLGWREDVIVIGYVSVAARIVLERTQGAHEVAIAGFGKYRDRRAWGAQADNYFACHANSGGYQSPEQQADYGLVLYRPGHVGSRKLAQRTAQGLAKAFPEALGRVLCENAGAPRWSDATDDLVAVRGNGVLFEPGFIDVFAHQALWVPDGIEKLGRVLADAILG